MSNDEVKNDNNEVPKLQPKRAARRIVIPSKATARSFSIQSTDTLLNDAKMIAAAELARYRDKVIKGIHLDLKESRVIQGYISELTKLQKEEREQARAEDLSNLSDDELLQLASQVLGTAKPKLIEEE